MYATIMSIPFRQFLVILTLVFQAVTSHMAMASMASPVDTVHFGKVMSTNPHAAHEHTYGLSEGNTQSAMDLDACGMHSHLSQHAKHCCSSAGCCVAIYPGFNLDQSHLTTVLITDVSEPLDDLSSSLIDRPPITSL
ncbi:MAG: hypothetical protein D6698_02870 [Gammaproteobacteria bacterium]|nr:MAG: hypothetical protein D6698_02870 [Gammaproteobacteria bacterium]